MIKNAQETQGDDAEYQSAFKTYSSAYKTEVIASADGLAENGDHLGAIQTVESAKVTIGEDDDLTTKIQAYENAYAEDTVNQIYTLLANQDIVSALVLLDEGKSEFPKNNILSNVNANKIETYKLINTNNDDSGFNPEICEDTLGNTYYGSTVILLPDDRYVEYNIIDKGVKYVTFTVAPYHHYREDRTGRMLIYADDIIIWSSEQITRKSEPAVVSVAIPDGCKFIKFQCSTNGYPYSDIMIIDPTIWT